MNMKPGLSSFVFLALFTASIGFAQSVGIDSGLLAKAGGGDAAAQVAVGEKLAAGADVPQDLKQAAEWYRKAADQGNVAG